MSVDELLSDFVILWAVIDPVGTVPVFIAATKDYDAQDKRRIARIASFVAFFILIFFFRNFNFFNLKNWKTLFLFTFLIGV